MMNPPAIVKKVIATSLQKAKNSICEAEVQNSENNPELAHRQIRSAFVELQNLLDVLNEEEEG